jgi:hypothetical protein
MTLEERLQIGEARVGGKSAGVPVGLLGSMGLGCNAGLEHALHEQALQMQRLQQHAAELQSFGLQGQGTAHQDLAQQILMHRRAGVAGTWVGTGSAGGGVTSAIAGGTARFRSATSAIHTFANAPKRAVPTAAAAGAAGEFTGDGSGARSLKSPLNNDAMCMCHVCERSAMCMYDVCERSKIAGKSSR